MSQYPGQEETCLFHYAVNKQISPLTVVGELHKSALQEHFS